jgi:tetratricopeptide (TPR) repeat protein
MRLRGPRAWIFLGLLLLLVAWAAYQGSFFFVGLYHRQAARDALARRDFAAASVHLNQSLDAWPSQLDTRLLAAQTERRRGRFDEAERHLDIYVQGKGAKEAQAAQSAEGKLFKLQNGDLRTATTQLAYCVDHPDAPDAPLILEALIEGSLRSLLPAAKLGLVASDGPAAPDAARARQAIDVWLQQCPAPADQVQGLVWRGRLHGIMKDHDLEVADYRAALERDPEHFEARWQLALAVVRDAPEETAAHLEILEQRYPDNRQVRLVLAGVWRSLGRLDEACATLDALLDADPDNVPTLLERGKLAVDALDLDTAERLLRQAEKLKPGHPEVNLTLSRCLHLRGKLSEAKHFRDRFEEINADIKRKEDQVIRMSKSVGKG